MTVDDYGLPIDSGIMGGEVYDCKVAPEFFAKLPEALGKKLLGYAGAKLLEVSPELAAIGTKALA